jgi:protein TonB
MYGVASPTNEIMVPFEYQDIDYYYPDSVSLVKKDGRWGYLRGDELDFEPERLIFHTPEIEALFKGCDLNVADQKEQSKCAEEKKLHFIYLNVRYPVEARKHGIQGRVVIEFFISPEGKIVEPRTLRDVGGGCSEEALRVVRTMPDWIPAKQDGQNVWSRNILPIQFKLQ